MVESLPGHGDVSSPEALPSGQLPHLDRCLKIMAGQSPLAHIISRAGYPMAVCLRPWPSSSQEKSSLIQAARHSTRVKWIRRQQDFGPVHAVHARVQAFRVHRSCHRHHGRACSCSSPHLGREGKTKAGGPVLLKTPSVDPSCLQIGPESAQAAARPMAAAHPRK